MPLYFTDEKLAEIPSDPLDGLKYLCGLLVDFDQSIFEHPTDDDRDTMIEFHSVITAYIESFDLPYAFDELPDEPGAIFAQVARAGGALAAELERSSTKRSSIELRAKFSAHFRQLEGFQLTEGDVEEINRLILELRTAISGAMELESEHRQRVLKKLESLQGEIHKKVSNFDRVVGAVCEVLVVVKKVGEAGEPWARMAKSLLEVVFRAQGQAYGLPSSAKIDLIQ